MDKKGLRIIASIFIIFVIFISCSEECISLDCWYGSGVIYAKDKEDEFFYFLVTDVDGKNHQVCIDKLTYYKMEIGECASFYEDGIYLMNSRCDADSLTKEGAKIKIK